MKGFFAFLLLFFCFSGFAQVTAEETSHDFGDLYSGAQTYVDFVFTNKSQKRQYLLTIDKPRDVNYIFSGKTMSPDSSIIIRLKINEKKKGRFNYDVDIYFSEPRDPITISLNGNVKEVNSNPLTDCPDFNTNPTASTPTSFDLTIKVIDSLTREPIRKSKVYLIERGELVGEHSTNNKGFVHDSYPLGLYYITAEKEGYKSNYHEGYINFKRNYVEIELSRETEQETEVALEDEEEDEIIIEDEVVDNETEPVEEVVPIDETPLEELPDSIFDETHFKFNNITFILDVSTSMNSSGKLDLLKLSMIELVKILRPEDQVTLIKYSSEVTTLMEHESGAHKEKIIETVKGLKSSGLTAGGDAIKEAYRINKRGYIEGGNNIVIMVTDGAFNRGDENYQERIAKYYESKGIRFSVVGIKTSKYLTTHMNDIVDDGGGEYIQIRTVDDARKKLIGEIKRTSFRSK